MKRNFSQLGKRQKKKKKEERYSRGSFQVHELGINIPLPKETKKSTNLPLRPVTPAPLLPTGKVQGVAAVHVSVKWVNLLTQ